MSPSSSAPNGPRGKKYWRSLNELGDKPEFREFVEREFPAHASEWLGGDSRRSFLKVMGASIALAGLVSCRRWPDDKLAPYAHRPANRMDGVPVHYASAYEVAGIGHGVVAVSFDGRPIKVDGNPTHPLTAGGSDPYLQASILNVYDPDRSRGPVQRADGKRTDTNWEDFAAALHAAVPAGNGGAGLVVLAEASRSPSVARLRAQLPQAKWFEYEVVSNDNQRAGLLQYGGRPLRAVPSLDQARVIVSIDADLFQAEPLAIKYNRDFAAGRKLRDNTKAGSADMNRLYVVETRYSITGSMADHRRGVKPSEIPAVLSALAAALGVAGGKAEGAPESVKEFLSTLAADIKAAGNAKTVFIAGHDHSPEVHAAVAALNAAVAAPVDYFAEAEDPRPEGSWAGHADQLKRFVDAAPGAAAILLLGTNPLLTAPPDLKIADLLKNAKLAIHAGTHEDETAQASHWHVPLAHYLEAWGDVRAHNGLVSITQPLIEPIFGARSAIELLSLIVGEAAGKGRPGYDLVRETAAATYLKGKFSDWAWKRALYEGIIPDTAYPPVAVPRDAGKESAVLGNLANQPKGEGFELTLFAGAAHDGRYANNGWLMEMPDPMTRVCWENPALVSVATAAKWGLESDDVVTLKTAAGSVDVVICILPGQPDGSISVAMGYGRHQLGSVAEGTGANVFPLRSSTDGTFISNVNVTSTGRRPVVACVQDHHTIDTVGKNRLHTIVPELVVEGVLEEYKKKPALGTRKVLALSMFNERTYNPGDPWVMAKWGMAIDLTTCTGCSACVIACQAENNVPVVGKEMVYRGREMHWLRIDRYFKWGHETKEVLEEKGDPQVVHQPILCMHCENAPCEEVCPVGATTHSREGLNMMTYNRCIGTRYCSNNCPYKVRRFNFFDFNAGATTGPEINLYTPNLLRDDLNELVKMQKNPQVTVRSRGVMEKCTYCVQRIEAARIELRAENRTNADNMLFPDGSVVTACQQACPTDAIIFGDLNQDGKEGRPLSRVRAMHDLAQSYGLLDPELNTKPRTQYLAKVRNPAAGLDHELYNEHTASEGFFWENQPETAGKPESAGERGAPATTPAQ
jgi:molybdopterin-containing oxidoreductase family iron-sulfur binding subunit